MKRRLDARRLGESVLFRSALCFFVSFTAVEAVAEGLIAPVSDVLEPPDTYFGGPVPGLETQRVLRYQYVSLNSQVLDESALVVGSVVEVDLLGNQPLVVNFVEADVDVEDPFLRSWIGKIETPEGLWGWATFAYDQVGVSGAIELPGQTFLIEQDPADSERHVIAEIHPEPLGSVECVHPGPLQEDAERSLGSAAELSSPFSDGARLDAATEWPVPADREPYKKIYLDVTFALTSDMINETRYSNRSIVSAIARANAGMIASGFNRISTNEALGYTDGRITYRTRNQDWRFRRIGTVEAGFGDRCYGSDAPLGNAYSIRGERNRDGYHSDVLMLVQHCPDWEWAGGVVPYPVFDRWDEPCGAAWMPQAYGVNTMGHGVGFVKYQCLMDKNTLLHELGHILGADHDGGHGGGTYNPWEKAFSNVSWPGWAGPERQWETIMWYKYSHRRVPLFSDKLAFHLDGIGVTRWHGDAGHDNFSTMLQYFRPVSSINSRVLSE